jgi:adenosylhomocysteine nucleosidase
MTAIGSASLLSVRRSCAVLLVAAAGLAGCAVQEPPRSVATVQTTGATATPRIAVISAFDAELALLRSRTVNAQTQRINGVDFTTGELEGKPVVLLLSGISMTNAAMQTQLVLDRFAISQVVFSGIAGGVDPALHIGDVTVPAQWGSYLESLFARETAPGRYTTPRTSKDAGFANFGMIHPRAVQARSASSVQTRFWFEVDAGMLAVARGLTPGVALARCDAAARCLGTQPKLVVGGNGVSGAAFVDNAAFRQYTFATFGARVLDMETSAVGQVAWSNGVPFIAFRSLSDLAGGGAGENEMHTFMTLSADNSAKVLLAFLAAWR